MKNMGSMDQESMMVWLTQWDKPRLHRFLLALLGVLAGILLGLVLNTIFRQVGDFLFPPPPMIDMVSAEQASALMKTMPPGFYSVELCSWTCAAMVGAYVSVRIARQGQLQAWITGFILGLTQIWVMLKIPHPIWVVVLSVILCGLAAYGMGLIAERINQNAPLSAPTPRRASRKPTRRPIQPLNEATPSTPEFSSSELPADE